MSEPFEDSAHSDLPNIHQAMGTHDTHRRKIWQGTRESIENDGLELGDSLGQGGFGIVFLARDTTTGRKLAIKVLDDPTDAERLRQFRRECKALGSEAAPLHIVPHMRYARQGSKSVQPYLVMEFIDGTTVHRYAVENELPVTRRIELIERIFYAFSEIHERGMVHGDPSPRNVMVERGDRVRLIDFGGSRDLGSVLQSRALQTRAGGTPGFAPLAQLTGEEKASLRSDLWGAAAVAFHLLTGKKTNEVESTEAAYVKNMTTSGVPYRLAAIIGKGLRQNKDSRYPSDQEDPNRYQSATEVLADMTAWRRSQSRRQGLLRLCGVIAVASIPLLITANAVVGHYQERERARQQQEFVRQQQELERLGPRRDLLGSMLNSDAWLEQSEAIKKKWDILAADRKRIVDEIDRGAIATVDSSFDTLESKIFELMKLNSKADAARRAREDFIRWRVYAAEQQIRFVDEIGRIAEEKWKQGNFEESQSDFNRAIANILLAKEPYVNSIGMLFKLLPYGVVAKDRGGALRQTATPLRGLLRNGPRNESYPFCIGVLEVTQKQYKLVMKGRNPSDGERDDDPVNNLTWDEAKRFCDELSALPEEREAGRRYRLPSEEEWEYACRAGTADRYCFGSAESDLNSYAWYGLNSGSSIQPVGKKTANVWGLHDMHGNVAEWCDRVASTDPDSDRFRVIRGGMYSSEAKDCTSESRSIKARDGDVRGVGMRVVLYWQ